MMKYLLMGLLVASIAATVLPAFAAGPAPRTGPGGGGSTSAIPEGHAFTLDDIAYVIDTIVRFILYASGFLMVGAIVVSGIMYITAGANTARIDLAKAMFWNSIKGAAIILAVGAILWTINGLFTGEFFSDSTLQGYPVPR